jgi:hypothetical protein
MSTLDFLSIAGGLLFCAIVILSGFHAELEQLEELDGSIGGAF